MKADLHLDNATVYDFKVADVLIGQGFRIHLRDDQAPSVRWFADNDKVLDMTEGENGQDTEFTAAAVGTSEIRLVHREDDREIMRLEVTVFTKEAAGFRVPDPVVEAKG